MTAIVALSGGALGVTERKGDETDCEAGSALTVAAPLGPVRNEDDEFTTLACNVSQRARATAYSVLRNWADAEEAVAEALAAAFESWERIRDMPHRE